MIPIESIQSLPIAPAEGRLIDAAPPVGATDAAHGASFTNVFTDMIQRANAADASAATRSEALAAGASDDIHGTMIATREAEISVHLIGSIRNKLLDAFHELWRTSV